MDWTSRAVGQASRSAGTRSRSAGTRSRAAGSGCPEVSSWWRYASTWWRYASTWWRYASTWWRYASTWWRYELSGYPEFLSRSRPTVPAGRATLPAGRATLPAGRATLSAGSRYAPGGSRYFSRGSKGTPGAVGRCSRGCPVTLGGAAQLALPGHRDRGCRGGGAWRGGPPPRPQAGGRGQVAAGHCPAWSLVTERALAAPMTSPGDFLVVMRNRESALAGGRGRTGRTPPRQPTPVALPVVTRDRESQAGPRQDSRRRSLSPWSPVTERARRTPPRQPSPVALPVVTRDRESQADPDYARRRGLPIFSGRLRYRGFTRWRRRAGTSAISSSSTITPRHLLVPHAHGSARGAENA
jgi:hypothetical protein